ncbi:MAG: hypothetical protein DRP01_09430, partial [Archaeoglobales archaeon]
MVRKVLIFFFAIVFVATLSISTASAFYDTFQNHPNDNVSLPNEYNVVWHSYADTEYGGIARIETKDIGNKIFHIRGEAYSSHDDDPWEPSWIRLSYPPSYSEHWIVLLKSEITGNQYLEFYVKFYDKDGNLINSSNNLVSTLRNYSGYNIWEFVKTGNNIYLYINGTYVRDIGKTYPQVPYFIEFNTRRLYSNHWVDVWIDEPTTDDAIVETFPHDWYILRHWDAPETSGLYNGNDERVEEHDFTISYMVPYVATDPCDEIKIKHFTTGEVVNITSISDRYGTIYYNFTEMFFHQDRYDDKYGLYFVELMRDENVINRDYFYFTWDKVDKPSGTISWDKDNYAQGDTARIHVTLTDADFSSYTYKGYVFDIYGNKKEEWTVKSTDDWHEVELSDYEEGVYYAILKITEKSTGLEWDEAYDTAVVAEEVRVGGVSYNARNMTILPETYVKVEQPTTGTSNEGLTNSTTAEYEFGGYEADEPIRVNASKEGFVHNNFTFTPIITGYYKTNLFLIPAFNNSPAIVGLVQSFPTFQNVSNATIFIESETGWNTTLQTNAHGYFELLLDNESMDTENVINETFNSSEYDTWVLLSHNGIAANTERVTNLSDETPYIRGTDYEIDYINGKIKVLEGGNMSNHTEYHIDYERYLTTTFTLNASKEGYKPCDPLTVTVDPTEVEYVYILLYPILTLTVKAKDASTHATITDFKVVLDDNRMAETENGSVTFTVDYGIHKVEVSADGYYSSLDYVAVLESKNYTAYLTPFSAEAAGGEGVGISYPPHQVEFQVVNVFGNPYTNVQITATPLSTTTGSWDWLFSLFGLRNESAIYYENQTINCTTDSRGACTMVMMENVEYEVKVQGNGINETMRIYPKSDYYRIIITGAGTETLKSEDYVKFNLSYEKEDDELNLSLVYNDLLNQTQNLTFYVYNSTTLLYMQNFTNQSNISTHYIVPYKAGEEYLWGFSAYHSKFGTVARNRIITIQWWL